MDYPKSVPGVGLVDGQFVDEDQVTGTPGSLIPAKWGNDVTQEILNLMAAGGEVPAEGQNDQMVKAVAKMIGDATPDQIVKSYSVNASLSGSDMGLLLLDAAGGARTFTLPAADEALGVVDVILRRTDNSGNRLRIQVFGDDRIKFHTHLNPSGYAFMVLLGAGDWWHLRSDGAGSWWPIGRHDNTPLGRPVFETTTLFAPGGYGALSGGLLNRADWPWLWDHAQQSGMLTTEAARVGMEGGWTSGDGALTFRGPEGRGEFLRVLDDSRGVDVGRQPGSWADQDTKTKLPAGANGILYSSTSGQVQIGTSGTAISLQAPPAGETRPRSIAYPGRIKLI